MPAIPTKVATRLTTHLKRFQTILAAAKARDVNESDTVLLVTDILADLFGYEKYVEITSEYAIRGTYVDLAIKIDGSPQLLIEVKAIGLDLRENHVRQAVDYGANLGVEWVILTNGIVWKAFRVAFTKPINQTLVLDLDLLSLNARSQSDLDLLYLLCREGIARSLLPEYHLQRQATNRYSLAAILLSKPVLEVVRRELRRLSPGVKIEIEEIKAALVQDVLKREVVEGEEADEARKKVHRALGRALRERQVKPVGSADEDSSLEAELAELRQHQEGAEPVS